MIAPDWLWIPVTVWAAFAQTLRNAAQRSLSAELGTLGATLVRFLYGLPFAALWLGALHWAAGYALPAPHAAFFGWVTLGALSQIAATALLLRVMAERNFALGVAYSKTELMQVAAFGLLFLGDPLSATTALAVTLGTFGVLLLSPADRQRPIGSMLAGLLARPALLGLASGAGFALSAVGFRGAALSLDAPYLPAAGFSLVIAMLLQVAVLGGWLLLRDAATVVRVLLAWRASLYAGFMGAAASVGWFTAMAIEPVAHVRTLGLVELAFSSIVSRKVFRERLSPLEMAGMSLIALGLVLVMLFR